MKVRTTQSEISIAQAARTRVSRAGLCTRKNAVFRDLLGKIGVEVYEDAVEMLRRWKERGLKTAVVSSSKNCEAVLKAAKLSHLFDARVDGVTSEQMKLKGKPDPDIFLYAAEEIGVHPSRAVMFEDALAGAQAVRAGGFGLVVGVARQGEGESLRENGADIAVQNLMELDTNREGL